MNKPMQSRYGFEKNNLKPARGAPPMVSLGGIVADSRSSDAVNFKVCKWKMIGMVSNSMALAISIRLSVPSDAVKNAGTDGPTRPPTLAPAAMMPKSRPDCSLVNRSDMKLQKTEI